MSKKIIITGATGLVGRKLCKALSQRGDELTVFSRNVNTASSLLHEAKEFVEWNYNESYEWEKHLDYKDAVIHLAGANIADKRWTSRYKKKIYDSRILSTQSLIRAISKAQSRPSVFISSSASGFYGDAGEELLTEESISGNDFLSGVCKAWEAEAEKVEHFKIRRVSVRTGIALCSSGGALKKMLLPYKLFLGGPLGNGKQWFPWIHIDDLVNIYLFSLDNASITAAINAASPNPVTMNEYARSLGSVLHRPSLFRVPKLALSLILGEAADAVTASQKIIPQKLLANGFKFKFDNLESALYDFLRQH